MNLKSCSKGTLLKRIQDLEKIRTFGLVWENKPEAVAEFCKNNLPVLKENKALSINNNGIENILIEGDSFHALSVLNYSHKSKIDLIYIDPPYNTGKKREFKYNDHWVDENDSFKHSKWLSFMEKRLVLAKNLLKETGTIFIAINDYEYAPLKLLCDQIFTERNFVASICWKSRDSISNDLLISKNHNYHLVYSKNFSVLYKNKKAFRLEKDLKGFSNPDNDPRGPWKSNPIDGPGGARKGNPFYKFLGIEGFWRVSKETMQEMYEDGLIIKTKKALKQKYFLSDAEQSGGETPSTWWDDIGTTTHGTKELANIIGPNDFNNPKPLSLLCKIIELAAPKNGIILDFMAGSGTTGHAVMIMNSLDNGKRRFILNTNNEEQICTSICYPRLKNAIKGYKSKKGKKEKGLGGNLRFFSTDFVDASQTDANKRKLTLKASEILCLKENTFINKINTADFKLFEGECSFTGIIFNNNKINAFKKAISKINKPITIYIFSFGDDTFDDEFKDLKKTFTLSPIPEAILRVYRSIFSK